MPKFSIALGSDHAGYDAKSKVIKHLQSKGISFIDFGTKSTKPVDYPDYIHPVADAIRSKKADMGIIFCGSANGVAMTANKHPFIRAAIAWNKEIARLARAHNDANILAVPARYTDDITLLAIVDSFFATEFEGGRHLRRIKKIPVENSNQTTD